jgi:metallopeptidase MepB
MAPKQYQTPPQAPPLFTASKDTLVQEARKICEKTRNLLDNIVKEVTPETATFENVILPIAEDENESSLATRIIGFYQAVSTDSGLRDASSKAEEVMDEANIEMSMREDVFRLVDAVYKKSEGDKGLGRGLGSESWRLLEKERKSFIRMGLGIEKGPKRDRFKEIKKRLSQVCTLPG